MSRAVPKRRAGGAVDVPQTDEVPGEPGGGSAEPKAVKQASAADEAERKLRQLVGRAGRVLDLVLRVSENGSEDAEQKIEQKPAAWKLRADTALKVLTLARSSGKSGTTRKATKQDAETEPEDDEGVFDSAFAHLR